MVILGKDRVCEGTGIIFSGENSKVLYKFLGKVEESIVLD